MEATARVAGAEGVKEVISIRRIALGGGFRYLMQSVAAGDENTPRPEGLAAYYTASGTPPGRFLGAGLADLDGGRGVETGERRHRGAPPPDARRAV